MKTAMGLLAGLQASRASEVKCDLRFQIMY